MPLDWIRPDGSLALFSWGQTDAWDELTGPEWMAHLVGTLDHTAEPVAGIPGPAAHLIAGMRLTAAEYWRTAVQSNTLAVEGAAIYYDAGRLYAVTAGQCRLFRARGRHEIFLTEPAYSTSDSGLADHPAGAVMEQILWAQDLPRPGDVYLLAVGVESEPPQGIKEFLLESAADPAQALKYCRGILFAGIPAALEPGTTRLRDQVFRESSQRASEAIIQEKLTTRPVPPAAPQPSSEPVASVPEFQAPPDPLQNFPLPRPAAATAAAPEPPHAAAPPRIPATPTVPRTPEPEAEPAMAGASLGETRSRGWQRMAGVAALAILIGTIALLSLNRSGGLFRRAPWSTGLLSVASEPTGARVTVDGKDIGQSPLQFKLNPGKHTVEARLGDLGVDRMVFDLRPGDEARYHPKFAGEVSIANQRPGLAVYGQLDGSMADSLPVVWKDVPAGRHLVSFSGPGVLPWTAEVRVLSGQVTVYEAVPQATTNAGEVEVSSTLMTDRGATPGRGDAIRVDSRPAGRTPLKISLEAGAHSVRVDHTGFEPQIQIVDLKAGQTRYVKAEFDGAARARVDVAPPFGSPAVPLIAATFKAAHNETLHELRLYYAGPGDVVFVRRVMTQLDKARPVFAAPLPPLDDAHPQWRYYVLAIDSDFNEVPSEVLVYGKDFRPARRVASNNN